MPPLHPRRETIAAAQKEGCRSRSYAPGVGAIPLCGSGAPPNDVAGRRIGRARAPIGATTDSATRRTARPNRKYTADVFAWRVATPSNTQDPADTATEKSRSRLKRHLFLDLPKLLGLHRRQRGTEPQAGPSWIMMVLNATVTRDHPPRRHPDVSRPVAAAMPAAPRWTAGGIVRSVDLGPRRSRSQDRADFETCTPPAALRAAMDLGSLPMAAGMSFTTR